jgi:hypothetical protein
MTTEPLSRTPEPQEVLRVAIEYSLSDLHTALPGRIETYDPATQKANVKPLIKRLVATQSGEELIEELPIIPQVPVVFPRTTAFHITFPVEAGDHVLLVFNERSIDNFVAGDGEDTDPDEFRMHDLTDAVALLGFYPDSKAIAEPSADSLVLGHAEGVSIHLAADKIELGERNAGDAASLDSLVQTELARIKGELEAITDDVNALKDVFSNWVPAPQDGGAALRSAAATWYGSAIDDPADPGETASELVTIKANEEE